MSTRSTRVLLSVVLAASAGLTACKKNPIDAALDEALDFSGFFKASDGTEIELVPMGNGGEAYVRTAGSALTGIGVESGDSYMIGMAPTGKPGEFRGNVLGKTGYLDWANVTLGTTTLAISWPATDAIDAQTSWSRIEALSPPVTNPTTAQQCRDHWLPILANNGPWKAVKVQQTFQGGQDVMATGFIKDYFLTATQQSTVQVEIFYQNGNKGGGGPGPVNWNYWTTPPSHYSQPMCRFDGYGVGIYFVVSYSAGSLVLYDAGNYEITFQKR